MKKNPKPTIVADIRPLPDPKEDGQTFINIFARGATYVGRELCHFNYKPFVHPQFGSFNTVEGFWHWYKSVEKPDELRYLNGPKCRALGQSLTKEYQDDFMERILEANWCKIEQNPELKIEFLKTSLPFEHYYHFGPDRLQIRPAAALWLMDIFDRIRTMMWNGETPKGLINADELHAEVA